MERDQKLLIYKNKRKSLISSSSKMVLIQQKTLKICTKSSLLGKPDYKRTTCYLYSFLSRFSNDTGNSFRNIEIQKGRNILHYFKALQSVSIDNLPTRQVKKAKVSISICLPIRESQMTYCPVTNDDCCLTLRWLLQQMFSDYPELYHRERQKNWKYAQRDLVHQQPKGAI